MDRVNPVDRIRRDLEQKRDLRDLLHPRDDGKVSTSMVHADNAEIIVDHQTLRLLKRRRFSLIPGVRQRVDVPRGPRRGNDDRRASMPRQHVALTRSFDVRTNRVVSLWPSRSALLVCRVMIAWRGTMSRSLLLRSLAILLCTLFVAAPVSAAIFPCAI